MSYYKFLQEYRRERLLLSASFVVLLLVLGGIYLLQNPQEFFLYAVQAYEAPYEVFASVIKGVAQR